jgi:hypothetical protein
VSGCGCGVASSVILTGAGSLFSGKLVAVELEDFNCDAAADGIELIPKLMIKINIINNVPKVEIENEFNSKFNLLRFY